jgi:hypothetical protein
MLELAEKHKFNFDTAQMPLNVMDAHFRSFGKEVVPVLVKKQLAVLGMKSMGSGFILKSNTVTPIACLHYALSLPTSVVITGIDSQKGFGPGMRGGKDICCGHPVRHCQNSAKNGCGGGGREVRAIQDVAEL